MSHRAGRSWLANCRTVFVPDKYDHIEPDMSMINKKKSKMLDSELHEKNKKVHTKEKLSNEQRIEKNSKTI